MNTLQTALRCICASTAMLWTTASHAEPSQAEIDRLIRSEFSKADVTMFGNRAKEKGMATKVHSVEKLACSAVSARVFVCDVEVDSTASLLNLRQKRVSSVRLVNASDGWRLSQ